MQYDVPLIPQSQSMSCWAASIAMILGWRDSASYSDTGIATDFGGLSYLPQMKTGLDPNDIYILRRYGFDTEAPQCYLPNAVYMLLSQYGPLWLASSVPGAHIRVITGMDDGYSETSTVYINDPWEKGMQVFQSSNKGAQYSMTFGDLMSQYERLGASELNQPLPVYVAHLIST